MSNNSLFKYLSNTGYIFHLKSPSGDNLPTTLVQTITPTPRQIDEEFEEGISMLLSDNNSENKLTGKN